MARKPRVSWELLTIREWWERFETGALPLLLLDDPEAAFEEEEEIATLRAKAYGIAPDRGRFPLWLLMECFPACGCCPFPANPISAGMD